MVNKTIAKPFKQQLKSAYRKNLDMQEPGTSGVVGGGRKLQFSDRHLHISESKLCVLEIIIVL